MLSGLFGSGGKPSYGSPSNAQTFPEVEGSLFVSKPSEPGSQKCVYLSCKATFRKVAEFSYDLVVSRAEDEDLSDSLFPADITFNVDPAAKFNSEDERLSWSDRAKKRYSLDFETKDDAEDFLVQLARALYEKKENESGDGLTREQALQMLEEGAGGISDLLSAAGELIRCEGELFNYDTEKETFMSVCPAVIATINSAVSKEDNSRAYVLMVFHQETGDVILEHEITNDMAPQFFTNTLSLVWLLRTAEDEVPEQGKEGLDPETQLCLSIKLNTAEEFVPFRNQFNVCLYEISHNASIDDMKLKAGDMDYIEASGRDDIEPMDVDDDVSEADVEDTRQLQDSVPQARISINSWDTGGAQNSQLALAYNNDRTFVVRGKQMGVFATGGEGADLKTTVDFKGADGSTFNPGRILLHEQDSSMLVLDNDDPTRVMRMDLERGQIVDTWDSNATNGANINAIQKTEKYSNLTAAQDFVGLNKNMLMRMDPRTSKFIVQSKKYAAGTRAKLECVATTGAGYLAVASTTGDIRLYDQIGKQAKTHLPGLGDKIISIDVTDDGNFVLATTAKYLLIIDTRVDGQEKGGFLKSMGKDKPPPRKLVIKATDIAKYRMGEINFTSAHFNTGASMERSIVTSTGPFIVTWNFRAIKMGKLDSYKIKRYRDNIVADDFAYNDDGRIVVTLPNNVGVARR